MEAINIPDKFALYWAQNAGSPYVRDIPTASQEGITPGAASLATGFPPLNFTAIEAGGVPLFGQDANGINRLVTQWLQFSQAGGAVWYYDPTFATDVGGYPEGAFLQSTAGPGNFWISTADNNETDPDDPGTAANWTAFPGPALVYPSRIQKTNTTFNFNCATDYSLGLLRSAPGAMTVNLAATGTLLLNQVFEVADLTANLSQGPVTVVPPVGHLICGQPNFIMTNDRQTNRFKYYGPDLTVGQWSC